MDDTFGLAPSTVISERVTIKQWYVVVQGALTVPNSPEFGEVFVELVSFARIGLVVVVPCDGEESIDELANLRYDDVAAIQKCWIADDLVGEC